MRVWSGESASVREEEKGKGTNISETYFVPDTTWVFTPPLLTLHIHPNIPEVDIRLSTLGMGRLRLREVM